MCQRKYRVDIMALTKPTFGLKQRIVQGVENLLDAGGCFSNAPLEPTYSRSLQEIRASRQDNRKRHQLRMRALREQRQTRTVDAYLKRALRIYARQHSEQEIILHEQSVQPITQKDDYASVAKLVMELPPPKRRSRAR